MKRGAPAPALDVGVVSARIATRYRSGGLSLRSALPVRAEDLSGIACRPAAAGAALDCLVVNDEGTTVQRVAIAAGKLQPGTRVPLIGDAAPQSAFGSPPNVDSCPSGVGKSKEFDGEGMAFAAASPAGDSAYHIVGSHGCSRNKDEFRASSFLLARILDDGNGTLGQTDLTWRVSEALRAAPPVNVTFGLSLQKRDGLNIESIAAVGDRLLFVDPVARAPRGCAERRWPCEGRSDRGHRPGRQQAAVAHPVRWPRKRWPPRIPGPPVTIGQGANARWPSRIDDPGDAPRRRHLRAALPARRILYAGSR